MKKDQVLTTHCIMQKSGEQSIALEQKSREQSIALETVFTERK